MDLTPEGFLICRDVPINRTGDQQYLARELQLDGDPDRVITVHRYPEDVFAPAALASFEAKDVTQGHPPENISPENHSLYSKGHCENVRRSGDFTVADLHIKDAALISDIRNGVVREISCGYLCKYVPDGDGYRQTNIRGNHIAVVPKGRAGSDVAIQDHAAETTEKGKTSMSKFTKAILTALGAAAKDAAPEEMETMVDTAAAALEAAPADKAPEAEPAKAPEAEPAQTKSAEDAPVEQAPKAADLGGKLDKILETLAALVQKDQPEEEKLSDESNLDELIEKMSKGKEEKEDEKAVTIPADEAAACSPASKDAAVELLKNIRPAVAAIQNKEERARVVDALLSTFQDSNVMNNIMDAAQAGAKKAADAAAKTNYERICAEQQAAYDARNPHKKKED